MWHNAAHKSRYVFFALSWYIFSRLPFLKVVACDECHVMAERLQASDPGRFNYHPSQCKVHAHGRANAPSLSFSCAVKFLSIHQFISPTLTSSGGWCVYALVTTRGKVSRRYGQHHSGWLLSTESLARVARAVPGFLLGQRYHFIPVLRPHCSPGVVHRKFDCGAALLPNRHK